MLKIVKWILIALGALFVVAIIATALAGTGETGRAGASESASPTAEPTETLAESASGAPSAAPSSAAPATPAATENDAAFGDGSHQVGSDVHPGTYRGEGGTLCYWERLSGFGGTFEEIIANGAGEVGPVVTIEATDAGFSTQGCGNWTDDLSAVTSSPTGPFGDGTFIVGTDVAPGNWSAPGGDLCYWERLNSFTGEFDSIIANGAGETGPIVAVAPTDVGFQTGGCGEWTQG